MNSRRPVCHICGGSEPAKILSLGHGVTSDCKPWPFPVEVFDCAVCGTVQHLVDADWRRRVAGIYDSYESYAPAGGREQKVGSARGLESRSQVLIEWLASTGAVSDRGDLLEIGCGRGGFLRSFTDVFPAWRIEALEWDVRSLAELESVPGFRALHTGGVESVPGPFGFFAMVHALEHFENPSIGRAQNPPPNSGRLPGPLCNREGVLRPRPLARRIRTGMDR
jgi:hypothetical protein